LVLVEHCGRDRLEIRIEDNPTHLVVLLNRHRQKKVWSRGHLHTSKRCEILVLHRHVLLHPLGLLQRDFRELRFHQPFTAPFGYLYKKLFNSLVTNLEPQSKQTISRQQQL
jgi:hypothetical protein